MYIDVRIECLFLDFVGPMTHQVVQTNYHTAATRGIHFFFIYYLFFFAQHWCVIGPTTPKTFNV